MSVAPARPGSAAALATFLAPPGRRETATTAGSASPGATAP
ncbi:hypothetical protein [Nocardia paucivorans]|nr:hypothetical protein [Nocardia paucivorans]